IPGTTVADDVRLGDGRVALPKGTVLSSAHLTACKAWGIPALPIAGETSKARKTDAAEPDAGHLAQAARQQLKAFRHTDRSHPMMAELLRLSAIRKAHELGRKS
nr:hypothetical protein [Planctomycetota bacterium]